MLQFWQLPPNKEYKRTKETSEVIERRSMRNGIHNSKRQSRYTGFDGSS